MYSMSQSQAVADFLEAHGEEIVAELARFRNVPLIDDVGRAAREWLSAQVAALRGQSKPCYEWTVSFVNSLRHKGGQISDILAVGRAVREVLLRFCSGTIQGLTDADLHAIANESESQYLTYIGDIYSDIERKASTVEHRLQRTIVDWMDRAFATLDGEGFITSANARLVDLTGLTEDRLVGSMLADLCDSLTADEIRRALRQRRTTTTRVFDGILMGPKGVRIPLRFWALPLFNETGLRSGLAVSMADAENAGFWADETLRAKMLEDLAETIGIGCYTIDDGFRIVSVNSLAHALVAVGSEDNGTYCCRHSLDAHGKCSDCFRRKIFETGQAYRATVQHKTPTGELRWIDVTCVPLRGRQAKVHRVTKFIRDVTEQRLLEDQYLRQQRTSFASQLAITVAHQLRNPLGVMIGFAEMLLHGIPSDQIPSVIDRILRNGVRCKEIVQNLLEFGRGVPGEQTPADVNTIIRERVIPQYPGSVAGRITWRLAERLPPVECAPVQLAQVFVNLADNALAAAKSSVIVETSARNDRVYVKVWDDGPGVPDEIRERIFDPFFTTRKEQGGIGLGLCLSRAVVQEHRGLLYLDEMAASGACFIVQLPSAEHAGGVQTVQPKPEPVQRTGRRIIIIEDETDLLFLLTMALQAEGHEVDSASSGAQGMEMLQRGSYDAAVIDMLLGDELGGRDLYQILLRTNPDLAAKCLFITGDTMSYETRRFLNQAKRPFMEKPFMISDFIGKLNEIMGAARPN
jgi:PAS domain S-box-containing protein